MRFLFLLYGDPAGEAALTGAQRTAIVEEHLAFRRRLAQAGWLSASHCPATFALSIQDRT